MSFSTETSVGGLYQLHGDTGRARLGKSPNRSGGRFGEKWCQSVYCVAAVGTRRRFTGSQAHLIPWSVWAGMDGMGGGKLTLCRYLLGCEWDGGEKTTASPSPSLLSPPLSTVNYQDYQTSPSISQYFLVTSLIIILPYIPWQRLTKRDVIIWFPLTQPSGKSAFQSSGCTGNKPEITMSIFSDFLITVSINMASHCKAR